MRFALILLGLLVTALWPADAHAERRVALVVGNAAYERAPKLDNPLDDAGAVADLLRGAGFEVVDARYDLGSLQFKRVVREFADTVRGAEIAVVYYAGHGIEIGGTNYLIPTDARLASDLDAEDEALSLDRIVRILEPAKRLRLVILDACRDNPFINSMRRTVATRAVSHGLAKVEPATSDTLIAFAAKAGSTADDGSGKHSPFTGALLKHITVPGLDVRLAFGRVRDEVLETTNNRQEPFVYGSLGGSTVALVPAPKPDTVAAPPPEVNPRADARRDYELAERVGTLAAWDSFLAVHRSGFYADLARAARSKLVSADPGRREVRPSASTAPERASGTDRTALASPTEPATSKQDEDAAAAQEDLARRLQTALDRVGCDPGDVDGDWGAKSRAALALFNRHADTRLNTDDPTSEALDVVSGKTARVCPLECGRNMKVEGDRCVAVREPPGQRGHDTRREREQRRNDEAREREGRRKEAARERAQRRKEEAREQEERRKEANRERESRRERLRRRDAERRSRASRTREARPARSGDSPFCESPIVQNGRRCCTYDRGGAPRIICQ